MVLIADSGSSKCDWALLHDNGEVIEFSTMGFNPFFHEEALITNILKINPMIQQYANQITILHYYGAGCSSPKRCEIMNRALKTIFNKATINIAHDLDGAAFATCKDEKGIACILGTGSNSCYYDGTAIIEEVPALGHVLGDEGGGAYYGRQLLTMFLYNQLPPHVHDALIERHSLTKEMIFENVYNKPNVNVYLASFMRTLSDMREDPWVRDYVYRGMSNFINFHIWCYKQYKYVPTHFVGAIAYFFQDILRDACKKHRITVGKIQHQPIKGLIEYHKEILVK